MEQDDNEVVRDVFGDSDEEEPDEYPTHNELEQDSHVSQCMILCVFFL